MPRLAGLDSISPQSTARFKTWRRAWVASKRCPSGIVSRHAWTLPRRELREPRIAERRGRLAKQPAQFRHRDRRRLMDAEVLADKVVKRHRGRSAPGPEPVENLAQRPLRLRACREPAHLPPRRAATCIPVPVGPQRLVLGALRPQLEHLTLLDHGRPPCCSDQGSKAVQGLPDHLSRGEGVIAGSLRSGPG